MFSERTAIVCLGAKSALTSSLFVFCFVFLVWAMMMMMKRLLRSRLFPLSFAYTVPMTVCSERSVGNVGCCGIGVFLN